MARSNSASALAPEEGYLPARQDRTSRCGNRSYRIMDNLGVPEAHSRNTADEYPTIGDGFPVSLRGVGVDNPDRSSR